MYCTNCGNEISDDSVFCDMCGKTVEINENNLIHKEKQDDMGEQMNVPPNVGNDDAIVLNSTNPLPNKMKKWKKVYWVFIVILWLCVFNISFLVVWLLGIAIYATVESNVTDIRRKLLRRKKFKFVSGVGYDEIFAKLQPILIAKYNGNMLLERGNDGRVVIFFDNCYYDILLNDDCTFCIWWRLSIGSAFISFREYKLYRKVLAGMGIIGYEIQNAFEIRN